MSYMPERPYTLLSCGMSIDGYIDTATDERLVLSNDADLDRVDAVRADSDAILVGAATLRNDNPRLLVRGASRRAARIARGLPPTPIKVTVTSRAELDPCADFFVTGDTEKLVYCPTDAVAEARCRLSEDLHARRRAADGRGRREGPHPVPHGRPCGRAAPGRGAFLRGRLAGAAVRRRWKLPVEPRPPCGAGGGAPARQRRTPALRALGPFRPGLLSNKPGQGSPAEPARSQR